jgi:autotransporter strand-loop-strand O-heptosyltransferase
MAEKRPNIFAHGSYVGTTGYNNHTRNFFRALSNYFSIKVRNFTIGSGWEEYNDTPHDKEPYIDDLDRKTLYQQSLWDNEKKLHHHPIYSNFKNNIDHDINLVLCETDHHYFYENYTGPKIAYNVWETTRQPKHFFEKLKEYNQIWVASSWQRDCTIDQGIEPEKVKVVPEAVDGNIFKPNPDATLPEYEDSRFKFVLFGRWDYRKSTKEVIQAFLQEFDKDEPIDLILSIDNPFAKDGFNTTEERLQSYNLTDPRLKIKHFPTREEYIKYLQKGHVFLSCARSEGWNLPLIEAMACGTPSIYSNCSGQLEFAEGRGLPVKIKNTVPAQFGEYNAFHRHLMEGEFYEPDFDDLKKVMRDAYTNYATHKKVALEQSKEIRKEFTWNNAAQIAGNFIMEFYNNLPKNKTEISFEYGPKVEVKGDIKKDYFIEFIDSRDNKVIHSGTIQNNMWIKCAKEYYIPWTIRINGEIVHKLDLTNKKVKISFDSKSVGDTLAWMPQVIEFKNKFKCNVVVSTFHNEWFENSENYKNIFFVKPDTPTPAYAHYKIGWFKTNGKWDVGSKNPIQANTIPLIQAATDILGLPYKEVNYGINFTPKSRPLKEKYICIAPRATAGLKEWPHNNWRILAKKLHSEGYKIVNISYEGFEGTNIINKKGLSWEDTWNYLYHAELLIGLGSGLSWANWALEKHTVMVNNFIPFGYEFTQNITKIENNSVCNNCWINKEYVFDPGNWNWCPKNEGTSLQHICQKSLSVDQVLHNIKLHLSTQDIGRFTWITGGDQKYLEMIEVLAKSLLKYSKHNLIVYGFNCDSNINLPNVTNRRIDFENKPKIPQQGESDLVEKDFSIYFAKYLASISSLKEGYDTYAWIDGDAFATESIDESIKHSNSLQDYPLFMRYYHKEIAQWRKNKTITLNSYYGAELADLKGIKRNPNKRLIAAGFYFYNQKSKEFFEECIKWGKELSNQSIKVYVDSNAFSEERVANNILWNTNKNLYLPVTWNNYHSKKEELKVPSFFTEKGFDIMYDEATLKPYFIHGPDPYVKTKNAKTLNDAFEEYQINKLMVVAHPDDELIFGGQELINHGPEYKVICLTNKSNVARKEEFIKVMIELKVGAWEILDFEDSLTNPTTIPLLNIISTKPWEKIVTHNPIGEYGHPQHKTTFISVKQFIDSTNNSENILYVFGKGSNKLNKDILDRKKQLLKIYSSEEDIIDQILHNNGDWFKSNNPNTNYIEFECIEKYNKDRDTTPFIPCYEK